MAAGGSSTLEWSNETYSIAELIQKEEFSLPLLVKVDEGIRCDNDSETFSQDDLLRFDSVKLIPKVVACCMDFRPGRRVSSVIGEDRHGYVERSEDFTIPLRYKGVVKIVHPEACTKVYHNIREVVKDFPRYVQAVDPFVSKNSVSVPSKSTIEVDRFISDLGLLCYVIEGDPKNSSIRTKLVFDIDDECSLLLLPDESDYTLEEVVKRFPLPQYVRFEKESGPKLVTTNIQEAIDHMRIFEGTVKVKKQIAQKTIIGHYKAPEQLENNAQSLCQRTLVIIPLDSPTARDIEVRVPLDEEGSDQYELVLARNFTMGNALSEENIDGTVYADFLKTPKATFVHYDEIEFVPPRPPRKKEKREENQGDYLEIDDAELLCFQDADKETDQNEVQQRKTTRKKLNKLKHRFSLHGMRRKLSKLSMRITSNIETHQDEGSCPDPLERFESLSSADLYNCLLKINMGDMAKCCLDRRLTGVSFGSISDEQLKNDFNLSRIQVMKFRKFQNEGWLPQ